jgi:NhaA family Na+:H+ antiporter
LPWAIALGLVVGKIVGISAAVWLAVRTGLGRLPQGVGALHVPAVAAVAGIGFTVSLFIADLAYNDPSLTETAKVGIFAGSLLAGVIGAALMIVAGRRPGVDATPYRCIRSGAVTTLLLTRGH